MAFTLSETGIRYSKFLKSVMLPFNEIRSIIITEQGTSITTRTGENYMQKESTPVSVDDEFCNYVVKYNIEYRNDTECIEGTRPYSREELDPVIERVVSASGSYADAVIKLFFMTEWSPVNQRGYYAVTEDVVQEDLLKSYVEEWSRSMCTEYLDYLDEET